MLGDALVDRHEASGVLASVYVDTVRHLALETEADGQLLLGRVIAHELGHLLLGSTRHAGVGLMRAAWLHAEIRWNRRRDWVFTPIEVTTMVQRSEAQSGDRPDRGLTAKGGVSLTPGQLDTELGDGAACNWIDHGIGALDEPQECARMEFRLDQAMTILRRTPRVLNSLIRDLPDAWTMSNEGPGSWSPFDIMGHLIHAEQTDWIPRATIIVTVGETQVFEPFDRQAQFTRSHGVSLAELIDTFARLRSTNLATLEGWTLSASDLQKRGTHPELGTVTLGELLATWTAHDLSHLAQMSRVMCRQYQDAVGPWRAYLSILQRS